MDKIQSSRVFGDYIIKRKLGAGGMASVYYAVHGETGDEVALKILHEHYADDSMIRKRLEHEARIVMRLNHPHIVPVLSFGESVRRPYLVMPYYPGGSLAEYFKKPRSVKHETTIKLLTILASALDYAHSQEVVHRDFKLENILIGQNNLPAISDFGIAQSSHTTRITMTGQILGTPQYLAPENLDTNGKLNYKADFYALGVMAYLMFTGYFPFTAADPLNIAIKHRTEHAPQPSMVNPNLPTTLDSVLLRGLAKNPDDRYPSAKEFVEALEDAFSYAALVTTQIFIFAQNPVPPTQAITAQAAIITPDYRSPDALATKILLPNDEIIPAAVPVEEAPKKKKRGIPVYFALLTLLLCAGLSFGMFMMNDGTTMLLSIDDATAELTAESTSEGFAAEDESEESIVGTASPSDEAEGETAGEEASVRASSTPRATSDSGATSTRRATNTPRPTNTARSTSAAPSNTARPLPSNTPQPQPTNTPQPQATSVPPTNPPPTSVPPTNPPPPTSVPPTNPPPPTSVPPTSVPPTNPPNNGGGVLDPVLDPVDTIVPCIPIPLVRTCD